MHTNGYEAQSDEGCSSVSRSTPNGRQSIGDPLSDRWRIHEMYAAQYRQETEKGIPRLGYLPLSQEPLRISNSNHLSDEWRPSTNRSESSRGSCSSPISSVNLLSTHTAVNIYLSLWSAYLHASKIMCYYRSRNRITPWKRVVQLYDTTGSCTMCGSQ